MSKQFYPRSSVSRRFCIMRLITIALITCLPLSVSADSAEQWLDKMSTALVQQSFQGTFIYARGDMVSSMRITHRFKDGREQERLIQLDGEMGEIFRDGERVTCLFPGGRMVSLEQTGPTIPFSALRNPEVDRLPQYMAHVSGQERVAGFDAVKVAITAKDSNRYSYLLWLEEQTGFLLKSVMLDGQGAVLERFQYTQLELGVAIADEDVMPGDLAKFQKYTLEAMKQKPVAEEPSKHIKVGWLPPGFAVAAAAEKSAEGTASDRDAMHKAQMWFSDGLASFSVFIESAQDLPMPGGSSRIGGTVAYSHQDSAKGAPSDYIVMVVGEIPVHTAMRIAESVIIQ